MFECQQFSLAIKVIIFKLIFESIVYLMTFKLTQNFVYDFKCCETVMKNKAISSPSDEISIILFGTNQTSNTEQFEHIFVKHNLQRPSVESITEVRNLITDDFSRNFGHNNQFSLADAFWTCVLQFTKRFFNCFL
jgi:4-hydroxy-3-methylbut-2-enyl diphosphate reductase IspH